MKCWDTRSANYRAPANITWFHPTQIYRFRLAYLFLLTILIDQVCNQTAWPTSIFQAGCNHHSNTVGLAWWVRVEIKSLIADGVCFCEWFIDSFVMDCAPEIARALRTVASRQLFKLLQVRLPSELCNSWHEQWICSIIASCLDTFSGARCAVRR